MSISNEQYERLMRFMDMDMSVEEMKAFKSELEANPQLQAQLEFEEKVQGVFITKENEETSRKTGHGEEKIKQISDQTVKKISWFRAVAAASVVIGTCMIFILTNRNKLTRSAIISNNKDSTIKTSKPDSSALVKAGTDSVKNNQRETSKAIFKRFYKREPAPDDSPVFLAELFQQYEKGDLTGFEKIDPDNLPVTRGGDDEAIRLMVLLYKGVALLEKGSTEKCIEYLDELEKKSSDEIWKEKANWYIAMAYLQKGDKEKAVVPLKKSGLKAKEILASINR